MVVNLIIAVICDAVHVLGKPDKDGLHGYDSNEFMSGGIRNSLSLEESLKIGEEVQQMNHTELRLQELQQQLDEMVIVQKEMGAMIDMLVKTLRENAERERSLQSKPAGEIRFRSYGVDSSEVDKSLNSITM